MTDKIPTLLVLIAAIACGACSEQAPQVRTSRTDVPGGAPPRADAQTQKAVAAANAFLDMLTPAQRTATLFAFTDQAQRQLWSNLPVSIVPHRGVAWGDLNPPQRAALMTLLGTILSPEGVAMVREQMDADDTLRRPAGAPAAGGRGAPSFGSDYYYVSILGTPSPTAPWMLQYGGHHLGINATVVGRNITLAPSLTGGQPLKYIKDGKAVYIVENEVTQSRAMLASLTPEQRMKAIISPRRIDLVLGPGQDGKVLQPEGLFGSEMNAGQKAHFLALIEARLDILNADDLAAMMAEIRQGLDRTSFAWWGPTEPAGAAYFRIVGPRLAIEFSPQDLGGDATNHAHNMVRDPINDYGSAWSGVK